MTAIGRDAVRLVHLGWRFLYDLRDGAFAGELVAWHHLLLPYGRCLLPGRRRRLLVASVVHLLHRRRRRRLFVVVDGDGAVEGIEQVLSRSGGVVVR